MQYVKQVSKTYNFAKGILKIIDEYNLVAKIKMLIANTINFSNEKHNEVVVQLNQVFFK